MVCRYFRQIWENKINIKTLIHVYPESLFSLPRKKSKSKQIQVLPPNVLVACHGLQYLMVFPYFPKRWVHIIWFQDHSTSHFMQWFMLSFVHSTIDIFGVVDLKIFLYSLMPFSILSFFHACICWSLWKKDWVLLKICLNKELWLE